MKNPFQESQTVIVKDSMFGKKHIFSNATFECHDGECSVRQFVSPEDEKTGKQFAFEIANFDSYYWVKYKEND